MGKVEKAKSLQGLELQVAGRRYPERPPGERLPMDPKARLGQIVYSLKFAADRCSERERRLYKSIVECLAHAENAYEQYKAETVTSEELLFLSAQESEHD